MGLLDAFKQYISDIGGSLNPEIGGLLAQTGETIKRNARQRDTVMKGLLADPSNRDLQRQAVAQGLDMASIAPIGMTVWHGSPHKFTKFDMSKIGTGEGAQAYGHGLYMAEAPEVANTYRVSNSGNAEFTYNGKPITDELKKSAAWLIDHHGGDKEAAKQVYQGSMGDKLAKIIDRLDPSKIGKGGSTYKVDIPDEAVARMLDWDKKLSEQAPEVLDAIKKSSAKYGPVRGNAPIYSDAAAPYMTGHDFYRDLANALSDGGVRRGSTALSGQDAIASQHLKELGIPGIRYLDGGSRTAGSGSSNFVLFDDAMARILETNGIPTGLQAWKPGEWRGLLSP